MRRAWLWITVTALAAPSAVVACMWDFDTLRMERSRFPDTLELITGKFLRHSPEFYEWRVADRLRRLEADPGNVALRDDLAVAYDKLGRHDEAIATALATDKLQPSRYETAANLGTFLIHAGRPCEGLPHIERAIAINPDAHFGREKYQKLLVEYVMDRRPDGPRTLPLADVTTHSPHEIYVSRTFAGFVTPERQGRRLLPEQAAPAVKGVLGMMRFGHYDSPVLLEALGTLLAQDGGNPTEDAKGLACRAFLKASYEVPDGPQRAGYRALAAKALLLQTAGDGTAREVSVGEIEANFAAELADAEAWYADLRERERAWIREGRNPEAEFDKLYDAEPEAVGVAPPEPLLSHEQGLIAFGVALLAGFLAVVVALLVLAALVARRLLTGRWRWGHPTGNVQEA